MVGDDLSLQQHTIHLFHDSPLGGHSTVMVTKKKVSNLFYWKGLNKAVRNFVRAYLVPSTDPLQTLLIPNAIWVYISLDFIEGLHKSRGKDIILVVVDRLSKYPYFISLAHPSTAALVTQFYFEHIFILHSLLRTIVSDRDRIFFNTLGRELFTL